MLEPPDCGADRRMLAKYFSGAGADQENLAVMSTDTAKTERSLRTWSVILPSVVAVLTSGWTLLGMVYPGWFSDSIDYLLLGDYFHAALFGEVSPEQAATFRATRFPPLLPALLALVGSDTTSGNYLPAFGLSFACIVGGQVLLQLWMLRVLGNPRLSLNLGVLIALCPGLLILQQIAPASEPVLWLLVAAVLLLAEHYEGKSRDALLVMALLAALAPLARTIGVALIVPVVIVMLRHRSLGPARWWMVALTLIPATAWMFLRISTPTAEGYSDSMAAAQLDSAFGSFERFIAEQPARLWQGWVALLSPFGGVVAKSAATVVLILAAYGCWIRMSQLRVDAAYLVLSLGVIAVWPYPAEIERLLSVLLPIACVYAALAVQHAVARLERVPSVVTWPGRPWLWMAVPLLLATAFASSTTVIVRRAVYEVTPELEPFKRTPGYFLAATDQLALQSLEFNARMLAMFRLLQPIVGEHECVYSVTPALTRHYGQVMSVGFPLRIASDADAKLKLPDCRFFLVTWVSTKQFGQAPMYPARHLLSWTDPVLVSSMQVDGKAVDVAALLQVRPVEHAPSP